MAARLHYQLQDIAVPAGVFVIGRGSECQLALDDPQVSRRHAALRVGADGAHLEDLGSRNGVFLNGVRIEKIEPLHDGDQIRIGAQDLGFHAGDAPASTPLSSKRQALLTMAETPGPPPRPRMLAADLRQDLDEGAETTFVATGPMASTPSRPAGGLAIIGGVADKALALGRVDEAERILQRSLADIQARAQADGSRGEVDADVAERAAGYAIRLAAATGRGAWIDYVFRLYTALGALVPGRLVDELYAAVRKVKHTDKPVLHAYITRLREVSTGFGPAERFILQRLEGFERWAP
jgi:FHA domain